MTLGRSASAKGGSLLSGVDLHAARATGAHDVRLVLDDSELLAGRGRGAHVHVVQVVGVRPAGETRQRRVLRVKLERGAAETNPGGGGRVPVVDAKFGAHKVRA